MISGSSVGWAGSLLTVALMSSGATVDNLKLPLVLSSGRSVFNTRSTCLSRCLSGVKEAPTCEQRSKAVGALSGTTNCDRLVLIVFLT